MSPDTKVFETKIRKGHTLVKASAKHPGNDLSGWGYMLVSPTFLVMMIEPILTACRPLRISQMQVYDC